MLNSLITFPGHTFRGRGLSDFWASPGRIALGPADNFPYALSLLTRHLDALSETVEIVEEGFTKNSGLVKITTETSGGPFKEQMECTSVCIQTNPLPARFLAPSGNSPC